MINSDIRDGSLRECAAEMGLPMLLYESGEALRFDELGIRAGLRGIMNVMRHLGMLPSSRKSRAIMPVVARTTRWARASESGIVSHKALLGERVSEGQRLAIISDPLGGEESYVRSPLDGIVIGRSNLPLAHEGDALFHIASFRNVPKAEDVVESFAQTHASND